MPSTVISRQNQQFISGYIFGKGRMAKRSLPNSELVRGLGDRIEAERTSLSKAWVWLNEKHPQEYAKVFRHKIALASETGKIVRLLDIGVGYGNKWPVILKKFEGCLSFQGTALTESPEINKEILPLLKFCSAADLHRHFAPQSFDIVLSVMGVPFQLLEAVENGLFVLAKGGHLLLFGDFYKNHAKKDLTIVGRHFPPESIKDIIIDHPTKKEFFAPGWCLHLKKD
jgi:hypothetical protein